MPSLLIVTRQINSTITKVAGEGGTDCAPQKFFIIALKKNLDDIIKMLLNTIFVCSDSIMLMKKFWILIFQIVNFYFDNLFCSNGKPSKTRDSGENHNKF